ncbi:hypothetical protein [Planomonospora sp. ID82291]|nr:hypothetical protein [Planomonospora sp. ID82291]MBG0818253.1 hypothetical protein [Planomonospora sp. ID82291]
MYDDDCWTATAASASAITAAGGGATTLTALAVLTGVGLLGYRWIRRTRD